MTSRTPISRLVLSKVGPESPSFFSDFATSADRTAGDCLVLSEFDWMADIPNKSFEDCALFLDSVAGWIVPPLRTAKQLFEQSLFVPTGLSELDSALHGGLRAGHLVEIVGRAGLGKSQLCLTISAKLIQQQKRGVIYLDSERKFSRERFKEILSVVGDDGVVEDDAQRCVPIRADHMNAREFLATIKQLETVIVEQNIGLVVVDSIAAIARAEDVSIAERQSSLAKIATELKQLAETFNIPVLVTNQVTSLGSVFGSGTTGGGITAPALGNTWHHVINVRLLLTAESEGTQIRTVKITKSPDANDSSAQYSIGPGGVVSYKQLTALKEWADILSGMSADELGSL